MVIRARLTDSGRRYTVNQVVHYQQQRLDAGFSALSDSTRRGILERLGRGEASITDLATQFDMTLTGMKKHIAVLEDAALVTTEKVGRVRTCKLGPHRFDEEAAWLERYRRMVEDQYDHLEAFLERTRGDE